MFKSAILAISAAALITACSPIRQYHGYQAEASSLPQDVEPGEDTRSTVLARLGTPSTKSIFDDNTWYYMSATYASFAYLQPRVERRNIVAIKFDDDDIVSEILEYNADDGEIIQYARRETATRGRQLGLLEQIFGNAGTIRLPNAEDNVPGQIPGQ